MRPFAINPFLPLGLQLAPLCMTEDPDGGGGGGGTGAGDPPASGSGGGAGKNPVVFDDQKELDRVLAAERSKAERRVQREYEAKYGTDINDRLAEAERLRQEKIERERTDATKAGDYTRATESLKAEHKAREDSWAREKVQLLEELRQERITNAILAAASKHNAISAGQVVQLLSNRVKLDDQTRRPVVLDEQGQAAFVAGNPVPIDDLVKDFLHQNRHLVRASQTAPESAGGGGADAGGKKQEPTAGVEKAKADWEKAQSVAESTKAISDISRAHSLKRVYESLQRAKAS